MEKKNTHVGKLAYRSRLYFPPITDTVSDGILL